MWIEGYKLCLHAIERMFLRNISLDKVRRFLRNLDAEKHQGVERVVYKGLTLTIDFFVREVITVW